MPARPTSTPEYLASVDETRNDDFRALRAWVRSVLPSATETFGYRMPTYEAANGVAICSIAAQKRYLALYVCIGDAVELERAAFASLDVGKGCIRFRNFADLPRGAARRVLKAAAREARRGEIRGQRVSRSRSRSQTAN